MDAETELARCYAEQSECRAYIAAEGPEVLYALMGYADWGVEAALIEREREADRDA